MIGPGGAHVTRYLYDTMGRVVSETNAAGVTGLYEYDALGNLVRRVTDAGGDEIVDEYEYGADGQIVRRRTTADGQAVEKHYAYDVNGKLTLQEDTRGNQTIYTYDDADQYQNQVGPTGQVFSYTYDLNGRLESVVNADGSTTRNEYDGYGYLARSVTNWDDGVFDPAEPDRDIETRYQRDAMGNTILVTDTLGRMTRTFYDGRDRVLGRIANWDGDVTLDDCATLPVVRDENICTQYVYDLTGHTLIVTDTLGRMTRSWYDALGRTEAVVANWNPATLSSPQDCILSPTNESDENVCTLYGYDAAGNQITTTNALNQTSLTVYDAANRPIIDVANWDGTPIEDEGDCSFPPVGPDTNVCTMTYYDAHGWREATQDALGQRTEYGYDAQGRLISTTRYLEGTPVSSVNHYDVFGNRVGQMDPLSHTTTYVYDGLNRLVATVRPEGDVTTRGYGAFGRVVTTTDGLGHATLTDYDGLGRRIRITDPESQVTRYVYDGLGNQVAVTDANGVQTSYVYDGLNRQVAVVENDDGGPLTADRNVRTEYGYDALGNQLVITNALGYSDTRTTYDGLGRAVIVEDALGHETHTRYNALGYRTVLTDATGSVTRYSYDGVNRLTAVEYVSDSVTVYYRYDALGRRTAMTDTLGVTHYVYDDLGRIMSVSDPLTGTVGYAYDLVGNRTQLNYPDSRVVTNTYDADGRLIQVEDWSGGLTRYAYDAAGRLINEALPNGVVTTRQYDAADRLIRLTHTAGGNTLSDFQYALDNVGHHLWVTETLTQTTRVISNTHDPLGRLIGSEYSTGESFAYVYDAVGNRTLMTSTTPLSGTVVTTYTYDAAHRLTDRQVSDGRVYTYDWSARGQMLTEWTQGVPVRTFDYDGTGRMTEATVFTLTTRFGYNGDGARRVVEVVGQGATTYTLDYAASYRILAETAPTSTLTYLYGHDCVGESRDEAWLYYLNDAAGYVRQGSDEQGEVTSHWLFDPDGTPLEGPQGAVSHLICGGVYDWSTGLIFRGGRYFDPSLGIWLALMPLVVVQSWRGRKRKRRGAPWYVAVVVAAGVGGMLVGCGEVAPPPGDVPPAETIVCTDTPIPVPMPTPETPTPEPIPTPPGKIAYLTFDDGPEFDHYSRAIAEKLAGDGIAATFFLIGTLDDGTLLIPNLKDDVVAIRNSGHAIGIHGWTHRAWDSGIDYLGEIQMMHRALEDALGTLDDKLLRSPGGSFATPVPYPDFEDWYYYLWTMPQGDPGDDYFSTAEQLVRAVNDSLGEDPADNINMLLHSNRPGTYETIVNPTRPERDLIQAFKDLGYTQFRKLPRPGDVPGTILY